MNQTLAGKIRTICTDCTGESIVANSGGGNILSIGAGLSDGKLSGGTIMVGYGCGFGK